jgi:hypothetical protein
VNENDEFNGRTLGLLFRGEQFGGAYDFGSREFQPSHLLPGEPSGWHSHEWTEIAEHASRCLLEVSLAFVHPPPGYFLLILLPHDIDDHCRAGDCYLGRILSCHLRGNVRSRSLSGDNSFVSDGNNRQLIRPLCDLRTCTMTSCREQFQRRARYRWAQNRSIPELSYRRFAVQSVPSLTSRNTASAILTALAKRYRVAASLKRGVARPLLRRNRKSCECLIATARYAPNVMSTTRQTLAK